MSWNMYRIFFFKVLNLSNAWKVLVIWFHLEFGSSKYKWKNLYSRDVQHHYSTPPPRLLGIHFSSPEQMLKMSCSKHLFKISPLQWTEIVISLKLRSWSSVKIENLVDLDSHSSSHWPLVGKTLDAILQSNKSLRSLNIHI